MLGAHRDFLEEAPLCDTGLPSLYCVLGQRVEACSQVKECSQVVWVRLDLGQHIPAPCMPSCGVFGATVPVALGSGTRSWKQAHSMCFSGDQISILDCRSVSPPLGRKPMSSWRWTWREVWVTATVATMAGVVSVLKQDAGTASEPAPCRAGLLSLQGWLGAWARIVGWLRGPRESPFRLGPAGFSALLWACWAGRSLYQGPLRPDANITCCPGTDGGPGRMQVVACGQRPAPSWG